MIILWHDTAEIKVTLVLFSAVYGTDGLVLVRKDFCPLVNGNCSESVESRERLGIVINLSIG